MLSATIFDIKEFAVHDGPGVRQTVFFKGCPLRCSWCHNPEGLDAAPQLMVSKAGCTGCGQCHTVCPAPDGPCAACGACTKVCPHGLRRIAGTVMTSRRLADILLKDADYYASLGGGITFSGGEPLLQGDFLLELLGLLPGRHTAVQTCGHAPAALFRQVARSLSLVLMDAKLMDPALHRRYTGVDNGLILENLRWLCQSDLPFIVRVPLIPGVNDNRENLEALAALLAGAGGLQRVELLPYHQTAGAKYAMAGMAYNPNFDSARPVETFAGLFEGYGIQGVVL